MIDRWYGHEDKRLIEYMNNRLWAAGIPESEWPEFHATVFAVRKAGLGAPVDSLIHCMKSHGLLDDPRYPS